MTGLQFAELFESIAPVDSGVPGDELGFVFGNPEIEIRGIGCMWSVQASSIEACAEKGINLIVTHERLWLPKQESNWYACPPEHELHAKLTRSALLTRHGITVYRSHSNWDALPVDGIADSAVRALGFEGLEEHARRKFFSVQELPARWTVRDLADRVGEALSYDGVRVFGDATASISRFAFLIGGFGENQVHLPQVARDLGAELLIIGEMSEFIVIAALEMGLPVIETLHSVSEIPGIRAQAKLLATRLPSIHVEYIPSGSQIV